MIDGPKLNPAKNLSLALLFQLALFLTAPTVGLGQLKIGPKMRLELSDQSSPLEQRLCCNSGLKQQN